MIFLFLAKLCFLNCRIDNNNNNNTFCLEAPFLTAKKTLQRKQMQQAEHVHEQHEQQITATLYFN